MEHLALYRKYRPKSFKELIGQDHIVKALSGALEKGDISHAYLFAGSRGTGKTSVARILAREIGASGNDTYEIDAASNTGVEDIRALNEAVQSLPLESKFKVYIVDEVHMLSKSAFNALLKTLEEPPKHIVFILATTEIDKLPETVVSRCQVFQFKRPNQRVLSDVVLSVAKKEEFEISLPSAELLALLGDGSFRDTLGLLEKVIGASSDRKITSEEVETITGAPRGQLLRDFLSALGERDGARALKVFSAALKENIEPKIFLKLVLRLLRFALLLKFARDISSEIRAELSSEDFDFLEKLANEKNSALSSETVLELLNAYGLSGFGVMPGLPVELAVIRLTTPKKEG